MHLRKKQNIVEETSSNIKLNEDYLTVSFSNKSIELTFVEFNLLKKLYDANGRIYNRDLFRWKNSQ